MCIKSSPKKILDIDKKENDRHAFFAERLESRLPSVYTKVRVLRQHTRESPDY